MFSSGFLIPAMPYSRINLKVDIKLELPLAYLFFTLFAILTCSCSDDKERLTVSIALFFIVESDFRSVPPSYNDILHIA